MKIKELCTWLESLAPLSLQESYDNSGLIVGLPDEEIKSVLISLDTTEAIVDEAIALGANLIISHHPIVFKGLKKINDSDYVQRTVRKAIKHDIAIYAAHTNLDNIHPNGVSSKIAENLGLINTQVLAEKDAILSKDSNVCYGLGIIGDLPSPILDEHFLDVIKEKMSCQLIRHTKLFHRAISKIAVCGGSGSSFLKNAKSAGAEMFITGDFKYHEFFDAEDQIIIADIGHFESEQFTIELLHDLISNNFSNFAAHCTKINTNPVKYY